MAKELTLILNRGGLRSLVATGAAMSVDDPPRAALVHFNDVGPNAAVRLQYVHQHADHFNIKKVIELALAQGNSGTQEASEPPQPAPLARPHLLIASLVLAIQLTAQRLIWPAQFNGDTDMIARLMEQQVLIKNMAELERLKLPKIDMPLLDLTDQQLIELGAHMNVPWQKAWSCQLKGERPCLVCPACRRRISAFEAAGIVDPVATAALH